MEKLNMTNMNTLFKKGYLLAGVIMATNMFVANEVEAMDNNNNDTTVKDVKIEVEDAKGKKKTTQKFLDKLLSCENYFNLFGTLALSGANSYFKWWDYNAGGYSKLGCLGWRTKKFFDTVQLDFNLNLGRGAIWLIPHIINLMQNLKQKKGTEENNEVINEENAIKSGSNAGPLVSFLFKGILQGFVSIPLTFHIYNFSISISLDSMLWEFVIDKKFFKDKNNEKEGEIKDITSNL